MTSDMTDKRVPVYINVHPRVLLPDIYHPCFQEGFGKELLVGGYGRWWKLVEPKENK